MSVGGNEHSDLCMHDEIREDCSACSLGAVSEDDDSLDHMVRQASTPSLATLFKRGKQAGLLKPTTSYGEGT